MIQTPRLDLVPIPLEVHRAINAGDLEAVRVLMLPYSVTEEWLECVPAGWREPMLEEDPSLLAWLTRAVVLRETGEVVGAIGWHDRPNRHGMGEIGYQVIASHRRRGIAREALHALVHWGSHVGVDGVTVSVLRLTVSPSNEPSLGLVRELELVHVGEQHDLIDGLELIYERDLTTHPLP